MHCSTQHYTRVMVISEGAEEAGAPSRRASGAIREGYGLAQYSEIQVQVPLKEYAVITLSMECCYQIRLCHLIKHKRKENI